MTAEHKPHSRHAPMTASYIAAIRDTPDEHRSLNDQIILALVAEMDGLVEQFEALRKPLEEASAKGCHFVKQGDGPECRIEWPGAEDRENWCLSCFSHAVLATSNPASAPALEHPTSGPDVRASGAGAEESSPASEPKGMA